MTGWTPSPAVVAGLVGTPVLISAGQVLFKLTSERAGSPDLAGIVRLLADPYLLVALAIYGFGTIVWILVLKAVPLTVAYPFMALTFCMVPLLAWLFLGETVGLRYMIGTTMIIAGLLVVST